jgi:hypothetical protein
MMGEADMALAELHDTRGRLNGQVDTMPRGTLTIAPADRVQAHRCPCCGHGFTSVSGVVYRGQAPYAAYRAAMFLRHPTRKVVVAVGLVSDGDPRPGDRVAVALHAWPSADGLDIGIVEPEDVTVGDSDGLGRFLNPREALRSPLKDEFFRVAHQVCGTDPILSAFLNRPSC